MPHTYNRKIARLKVIKAIREAHSTDEALEARFLPESEVIYPPTRKLFLRQLNETLRELEREGVIEREASHGVWIMKNEYWQGVIK